MWSGDTAETSGKRRQIRNRKINGMGTDYTPPFKDYLRPFTTIYHPFFIKPNLVERSIYGNCFLTAFRAGSGGL